MNETTPEAPRQDKHFYMMVAIHRIKIITGNAQELLDRITTGNAPDDAKCVKEPAPTLLEILDDGPKNIQEECQNINTILENIGTVLFDRNVL